MVRKQHKVLSLILCLILAVSAVCAGTVGAFAASGDTVYCKLNNGWSKVYAYMWTDGASENAKWPGVEMTKVEDGVYSCPVTGNFAKIIFSNGNGGNGNQTLNLDYAGNGKIYDLSAGSWSTYVEAPTSATSATEAPTGATQPTTQAPTTPSGDGITVFLKNEAGWSNLHCYMWTDGGSKNKAWPGEAMTSLGDDVYMYTTSTAYEKCIFNSGSDANKTGDLKTMDGHIYNNKTNTWSVYDLSDLQVKSYTADPAKNVYVGTDVTISALAQNRNGAAVNYKFSVTNENGGTSVLSNFSGANSVVWTPSAAGTYTVNFDFKDAEGNENSRSLTLKVEDDSLLTKPVIKSVLPLNNNYIKVNSTATVSVKAGGGKTGTNLLFYKYVVTDPNNVKNTPYYTLNNTYSFTPSMAGVYTVNVFVQASDNTTVTKTYKYTATTGDITEPTTVAPITTVPTEPTTVAPTTVAPTTVAPTTVAPTTVAPTTVAPTTVAPTTVVPTEPTTAPVQLKGDVNGDGVVNIKDVTCIQLHLVDDPRYITITIAIGDVNGDGKIDIKDATQIQIIIANS